MSPMFKSENKELKVTMINTFTNLQEKKRKYW